MSAAGDDLRALDTDLDAKVESCRRDGAQTYICPIGNRDAYIDRGQVWCECGHDPADLRSALEYQARNLPARCTDPGRTAYGHRQDCQRCQRWSDANRLVTREISARFHVELDASQVDADSSMRVSGGYLFDLPPVAPIWGTTSSLLAAEGQGWMIVGPDGTGKTSAACQYCKARLALDGWAGEMWDLPIQPLAGDRSVYYLAMDRSRQMMEAFMRGVGPEHFDVLDARLHVHRGPPPYRLSGSRGQEWLLREVEETRAGLVVLDSRKDLGSTVEPVEVAGVATAVQLLVNSDVEVLVLAHPTKARRRGAPALEDVSGLRDVFSGLGSVVFLEGRPGVAVVDVHHLKPIREIVPKFKIVHDHAQGRSERLGEGIVVDGSDLVEGRMPVDATEVRVLATIDANGGEAPAASIKAVLGSENLARDLKYLVAAKVVEHNGQRGPQSGYRRGPNAPPLLV